MGVERLVYNLVKKNRLLKDIIKYFYQLTFMPLALKNGKVKANARIVYESESFFGFHDRPSLNESGLLLGHRFKGDKWHQADILMEDIHTGDVKWLASTQCCNLQQGSMLSWLSENRLIFNDMEDSGPVTRILDTNTGSEERIVGHYFSASPSGRFTTSINFLRFGLGLAGYGYHVNFPPQFTADAKHSFSEDRVSDLVITDLVKRQTIRRISMAETLPLCKSLIEDGYCYFSHSAFSPSENHIFFLLRSSNRQYNSSQLFVYSMIDDSIFPLPTGGMVSHLCWISDTQIVAYCNTVSTSDGYYIFDITNRSFDKYDFPAVDGHPHALSNKQFMTDTYPDRLRRQKLYTVDVVTKEVSLLLDIYSPFKFRGINRVDLHPRLSRDGRFITVDSSYRGRRVQLVLEREH